MSLPTLPSCWRHKNEHMEQQMARMHQQQQVYRDQWNSAANYYKSQNVANNFRSNIMSEKYFRKSMDAYASLEEKNRKAAALHERRKKLQKMLQQERDLLEAELKRLSIENHSRLKEMKQRTEDLKSAREDKRKQVAAELLYEHWKENNPELRALHSELHNEHVVEAWQEQSERKKESKLEEVAIEKQFANEYEEARLKAIENIRRKEEQKLQEEKETAESLRKQMKELKEREAEAAALKREEEELQREQWELDRMQSERRKIEEQRKKVELQRFLHHQFKAQLRRRALQIQEELEFDREILKMLQAEEERRQEAETERNKKAKADVQWMKEVLEAQLKVEKQREAELDLVYREEARRMWEQREEEWRKERLAREKLMMEVLGERSQQIKEKAESNRLKQAELLQEREALLEDLEQVQKTARLSKEEEERRKKIRDEELRDQITERERQSQAQRARMAQEKERDQRDEQEYEKLMRQERLRMKREGFVDKRRPRSSRRAWEE